jgi:hypothetical protein
MIKAFEGTAETKGRSRVTSYEPVPAVSSFLGARWIVPPGFLRDFVGGAGKSARAIRPYLERLRTCRWKVVVGRNGRLCSLAAARNQHGGANPF